MRTSGVWGSRDEACKGMREAETKEDKFLYYLERQLREAEGWILQECEADNFINNNKDFFYRCVGAVQVLKDAYWKYVDIYGIKFENESAFKACCKSDITEGDKEV